MLAILVVLWPYQSGHLEERATILKDHFFVVTSLQDGEWLFCLAVPFIAAFLIYRDRHELFVGEGPSGLQGLATLLIGFVLYWIGFWQDDRNFGFVAVQVLIAGLTIWLCGKRVMRAAFIPWLFLGFTWPFLPLEQLLALPLRNLTAALSHGALDLLGFDAIRHGTAVLSAADPTNNLAEGARFHLDVAQPCSGIRSLFSLMMVSAFYGYLALRGSLQRMLLFSASIPLAVFGNFVRILMLATGSVIGGQEFAVGTTDNPSAFHTASGFVVFAVALGGMIGIARLLEHIPVHAFRRKPSRASTRPSPPAAPTLLRSAIPLALTLVTLVICQLTKNFVPELSSPGLVSELPAKAGPFEGSPMEITPEEDRQLVAIGCTVVRSSYSRPDYPGLPEMLATVVISGPEERSLHEPDVCLPAQGWKQSSRSQVKFDVGTNGATRTATLVNLHRDVISSDGIPFRIYAYNLFWYEGYDVSTPSYQNHIAITQRDKLFRQLTHRWSLASLFTALPPVEQAAPEPIEMLDVLRREFLSFATDLTPALLAQPGNSTSVQAN